MGWGFVCGAQQRWQLLSPVFSCVCRLLLPDFQARTSIARSREHDLVWHIHVARGCTARRGRAVLSGRMGRAPPMSWVSPLRADDQSLQRDTQFGQRNSATSLIQSLDSPRLQFNVSITHPRVKSAAVIYQVSSNMVVRRHWRPWQA